jgi:hypothetical protein
MFGIQTYFISKAISYLIRILFFSIDNTLLDKDIFLIFLLGSEYNRLGITFYKYQFSNLYIF